MDKQVGRGRAGLLSLAERMGGLKLDQARRLKGPQSIASGVVRNSFRRGYGAVCTPASRVLWSVAGDVYGYVFGALRPPSLSRPWGTVACRCAHGIRHQLCWVENPERPRSKRSYRAASPCGFSGATRHRSHSRILTPAIQRSTSCFVLRSPRPTSAPDRRLPG
jgi:hypothetical protein